MREVIVRNPRRRTHGRRLGTIGLTLAAGLTIALVAGCSSAPSSTGGSEDNGQQVVQELKYGLSAEPAAFKTGVNQGSAAREVLTLIHRGLMKYDADGQPTPALAENYDVSDDGLTYTFELRSGLTFSDGSPLTSQNVKDTFTYLAVPTNGADSQVTFANVATIDTPSPTEVVLNLVEPQTSILGVLSDPMSVVVPEPALNGEANTVGAGPFMITKSDKGVGLTLESFAGYYDAANVRLKKIEMTFIADAQTRVQALMAGQVDMVDYVPREDYELVKSDDSMVLDMAPGIFATLTFNHTKKPFDDRKVRQAVAYATDYNAILQAALMGYGTPMSGLPIVESSEYFKIAGADHFKMDLDKAKSLMKEAGYGDGVDVTILTNSQYPNYDATAQVVKADLEKIGIRVTLVSGDYATQISKGNSGDYQMAVSGIGGSTNDPSNMQIAFLGGPSYLRSFGLDQEKYRPLLTKGAQTPDGPERQKVYEDLAQLYFDNVPFVTTSQTTNAFAYTKNLKGFKTLSGIIIYNSLYMLENAYLSD